MSTVKKQVEEHPVIYFLGVLLAGFIAGLSTYVFLIDATGRTTISKEKLDRLNQSDLDLRRCITELENEKSGLYFEIDKKSPPVELNNQLQTQVNANTQNENIKSHKIDIEVNSKKKKSGPLTDLTYKEFSDATYGDDVHFTVREEMERSIVGNTVHWTGMITNLRSGINGGIYVSVALPEAKSAVPGVILRLEFNSSQRALLMSKKIEDIIEFECYVYNASDNVLLLENCKIIKTK